MTVANVINRSRPHRRETGRVARLPVDVRNLVNRSLRDGQPYAGIIAALKARGFPGLTRHNLLRWRRSGYTRWLRDQETFERLHQLAPDAAALVGQLEPAGANPTADLVESQLALQLGQMLTAFDDNARADRPEDYFRLCRAVSAFMTARAFRQRAELERLKYEADIRAATAKPASSGLTGEQLAEIKRRLNQI
jgi:hypothetical protein